MSTATLSRTEEHLERAARVLAGGASASGRRVFREHIVRTEGAYLYNAEGRRYIDYLLSYGPIVIGHSDARVNSFVKQVADSVDLHWVGAQAQEVELAERIVELVPSAEKVAFVTSGSDALLHAVHVARAATGRRLLVKFHGSFIGWQDPLAKGANFDVRPDHVPSETDPNSGGLSEGAIAEVVVLEWNDFEGVRALFGVSGGEIAAVVCEPYVLSYGCVPPAPGFLELLRELTARAGALLVFDEVKTGFRLALGGYQDIAGVYPDLTALGKSMSNGYPLAAIAGRADLIDLLGTSTSLDGTHYANPYGLAAGVATVDILRDGAMERLGYLGHLLRTGLERAARDAGVDVSITGYASAFMINWLREPPVTFRDAARADFVRAEAFRVAMLEAGVLLPPFVITDARLCLATSEDDIEETVAAAERAFRRVA